MKYQVSISYHKFMFDDPVEAIIFAERAKQNYVNDEYYGSAPVTVDILNDDEKEGEE